MKKLGWIISLSSLIFIAISTEWKEFTGLLKIVDIKIVTAAFVLLLLIDIIKAFKMELLSGKEGRSLYYIILFYRFNLISCYYTLILPGTLFGGAIRWIYYRKVAGGKNSALMLITDNYSQIFAVFVLFVPASFLIYKNTVPPLISAGITISMIVVPFLLPLLTYLEKSIFMKSKFISKTVADIFQMAENIKNNKRKTAAVFFISVIYQCGMTFVIKMLSYSAGTDISLGIILFAITVMTIFQYIPSLLGGLGIREASLTAALMPFGVTNEKALLLGLLISFITIARGLVGGIAAITLKSDKFR